MSLQPDEKKKKEIPIAKNRADNLRKSRRKYLRHVLESKKGMGIVLSSFEQGQLAMLQTIDSDDDNKEG